MRTPENGLAGILLWFACVAAAGAQTTDVSGRGGQLGCDQVATVTQAERRVVNRLDKPVPIEAWANVELHDRLPRRAMGDGLSAHYRIVLPDCDQTRAVLIARAGAAYQVRIPGEGIVPRTAPPHAWWMPGPRNDMDLTNPRIPSLYVIPARVRELEVELTGLAFMEFGLPPLPVGPIAEIAVRQAQIYRRVIDWTLNAGNVVAVLAGVALLALARRRDDQGLRWFCLACVAWVLRGLYCTTTVLPAPPLLFESGVTALVFLLALPQALATLHLLGRWSRRWRRAAAGSVWLALLLLVAGLLVPERAFDTRSGVYTLTLVWMATMFYVAIRYRQSLPGWRGHVMVAGYLALMVGAAHDYLAVQGMAPIREQSVSMLLWGYALLLLALALVITDHVTHALDRVARTNVELEREVAQRTAALAVSYEQRAAEQVGLARERARREERERLVREMHDGIGGQLTTALRGVERGTFTPERVAQTLQDSLDDLRLVIDATSAHTQLLPALAAWRYRWDTRLELLGLQLSWKVDEAIGELDLAPDTVLQLMRILQEAVTNVVKHAHATEVEVCTATDERGLCLCVVDNGIGLPAEGPALPYGGHGLASMRHRAQTIGATLQWGPAGAAGTRIVLTLPR